MLCYASPLSLTVPEVMMGVADGFPALLGDKAGSLACSDLPRSPNTPKLAHGRLATAGQPEAALLPWEKVQCHMQPTRNFLVLVSAS